VPAEVGVNVTKQLAEVPLPERVHVVELNVPGRLLVNLTFPVGVPIAIPVSFTVAVQVVVVPWVREEGTQTSEVEVVGRANSSTRSPGTQLLIVVSVT
jgi:hypothetical protein